MVGEGKTASKQDSKEKLSAQEVRVAETLGDVEDAAVARMRRSGLNPLKKFVFQTLPIL